MIRSKARAGSPTKRKRRRRYFKLKLNGDPAIRCGPLTESASDLATLPDDYRVTLDANEQYADCCAGALVDGSCDAALRPSRKASLYRAAHAARHHLQAPLGALARRDFIVDEADDSYDTFPKALALGYRGISSKACKGIYKSLINATRAAKWSASGEKLRRRRGPDLPAGPCRAAGLALARSRHHPCRAQRPSLCRRLRRNAGRGSEAFLQRIPISMTRRDKVRLAIRDGDLLTGRWRSRLCVGSSGLVRDVAARAAQATNSLEKGV